VAIWRRKLRKARQTMGVADLRSLFFQLGIVVEDLEAALERHAGVWDTGVLEAVRPPPQAVEADATWSSSR